MLHQNRGLVLLAGIALGLVFGLGLLLGISGIDAGTDRPESESAATDEARAIGDDAPGFSRGSTAPVTPTLEPAPVVGAPAPDFELVDVEGETVILSEQRGGVVLLNFWATWCGPCRVEMPTLQAKYDDLQEQGFTIVGVNFDESSEDVRAFGEELELSFPLVLDPGAKVQRLYNIRGYPSSVIVDEQGVIQIIHIGILTEGQLDGYLDQVGLQS